MIGARVLLFQACLSLSTFAFVRVFVTSGYAYWVGGWIKGSGVLKYLFRVLFQFHSAISVCTVTKT